MCLEMESIANIKGMQYEYFRTAKKFHGRKKKMTWLKA